jgi:hypothetical protein
VIGAGEKLSPRRCAQAGQEGIISKTDRRAVPLASDAQLGQGQVHGYRQEFVADRLEEVERARGGRSPSLLVAQHEKGGS